MKRAKRLISLVTTIELTVTSDNEWAAQASVIKQYLLIFRLNYCIWVSSAIM